jgi:hypothetical protein
LPTLSVTLSRNGPAMALISTVPRSDTESVRYWHVAYSVTASVSAPASSVGAPADE